MSQSKIPLFKLFIGLTLTGLNTACGGGSGNVKPSSTPLARSSLSLVDVTSGAVVQTGTAQSWNSSATHSTSGDKVWWFDFPVRG